MQGIANVSVLREAIAVANKPLLFRNNLPQIKEIKVLFFVHRHKKTIFKGSI